MRLALIGAAAALLPALAAAQPASTCSASFTSTITATVTVSPTRTVTVWGACTTSSSTASTTARAPSPTLVAQLGAAFAQPHGIVEGPAGVIHGASLYGGASNLGALWSLKDGVPALLASLAGAANGSMPRAAPVLDPDGFFYLAASSGGRSDYGALVRVSSAGAATLLASFDAATGIRPQGQLVRGSDGHFYGTTLMYGVNSADNLGTVFRATKAGNITVLTVFESSTSSTKGGNLYAGLTLASDGFFYGTTYAGGQHDGGTVFRITPAGLLSTLAHFNSSTGQWPYARPLRLDDGSLVGTTSGGGRFGGGSVWKLGTDGALRVLADLRGGGGDASPTSLLLVDGWLYGGAPDPGTASLPGRVFRLRPDGSGFETVVTFSADGSVPASGGAVLPGGAPEGDLVLAADGKVYGLTSGGPDGWNGTLQQHLADPPHEHEDHDVADAVEHLEPHQLQSDGDEQHEQDYTASGTSSPPSPTLVARLSAAFVQPQGLVEGASGVIHGASLLGGASNLGALWALRDGQPTLLASLTGAANGSVPRAAPVFDPDGFLYLAASSGGRSDFGAFVRISSAGAATLLASFDAATGIRPQGQLVRGSDGHFYGTTLMYGVNSADNLGTVFRATKAGNITVLTVFESSTSSTKGGNPFAGLTLGSDGFFYGTTHAGGQHDGGTVFRITPAGLLSTLAHFSSTTGQWPYARPLRLDDGSLVGTTSGGGRFGGGTVWKLGTDGALSVLADLRGAGGDASPTSLLLVGGWLYGGAPDPGTASLPGRVFRLRPDGSGFETVVTFSADGSVPASGGAVLPGGAPEGDLVLAADGKVYGLTSGGPDGWSGTVFALSFGAAAATTYPADACSNTCTAPGFACKGGSLPALDGTCTCDDSACVIIKGGACSADGAACMCRQDMCSGPARGPGGNTCTGRGMACRGGTFAPLDGQCLCDPTDCVNIVGGTCSADGLTSERIIQ
ncbi:hypothetical protein DFJ74DRAFT_741260 [Hyaloraphidium curvatum]|nr:hypothetical protein DFJ74DRAFT_741260 [Hyaloraphidium curvatum]